MDDEGRSTYPGWFEEALRIELPGEGGSVSIGDRDFIMRNGLLRDSQIDDEMQRQTSESFGYKWSRTETYKSESVLNATRAWLVERYGDLSRPECWNRFGKYPLVLDCGCGSGLTARLLIGDALKAIHYVGADISVAVDVASETFCTEGRPGAFMQADLYHLPFPTETFDFILSEGVLHHTPSTREAIQRVAPLLKRGGEIAFYVYAKKAPIREFTDDSIRSKLAKLDPGDAWEALMSLTKLGKSLGELNVSISVPEDVPLLGIRKGEIDIQRFVYWNICKMYYRPEYSLEEMNHVNFDWFAPRYSHRQTPDQVQEWCIEAGLEILSQRVEDAGITTHATRP